MDPLTHSLIGAISAKSVKASPRRFWVMTLLGLAPDLDVFMNGFGAWATVFQHRGVTHSFLGLFVQALLYSFLLRTWDKGRFDERAFHYSLPLALHIFCDYVTSYGVPLFSPFSQATFSWDLAGSLNFFPVALTLFGLWWLHRRKLHGWIATAPVWGMWVLYFALVSSGRAYAARLTCAPPTMVTAVPSLSSPLSWRALAIDPKDHSYRHYAVDIWSGQVQFLGRTPQPNNEFPVQKSLNSPLVKEFIKNNRWPSVRVQETNVGWRVEWGSIIYSVRGMVRGKVAVEVAKDGQIITEKPIVEFWNPQLN
jgi:inner membrane protein